MKSGTLALLLAAVLVVLLSATAARADAIDGHWCADDGRSMVIAGSAITTPGGTQMKGDYARHFFSYTVPAAEPHAGARIHMSLVNENTVHLAIEGAGGDIEVWRRCDVTA